VNRNCLAPNSVTHTALAWWAAFPATLALVALLGLATSAQALTVPSPGARESALVPAFDEEGEEDAEAEAGEGEETELGCSFDEEECEGEEAAAPPECLVQSAEATVLVSPNRNRVRLLVRYATSSPTVVSLDFGLHGSKGSLYLGATRKRIGRNGVLHLDKSLAGSQMAKVMAAKGFTVRLRPAAAPGYCQAFFDHQLDRRRATPNGLSWLQSE
jgi:hypothetical protein